MFLIELDPTLSKSGQHAGKVVFSNRRILLSQWNHSIGNSNLNIAIRTRYKLSSEDGAFSSRSLPGIHQPLDINVPPELEYKGIVIMAEAAFHTSGDHALLKRRARSDVLNLLL